MKIRDQETGKIYDLGESGLLRWVGGSGVFHVRTWAQDRGVIEIFSPGGSVEDVERDARELCSKCGK